MKCFTHYLPGEKSYQSSRIKAHRPILRTTERDQPPTPSLRQSTPRCPGVVPHARTSRRSFAACPTEGQYPSGSGLWPLVIQLSVLARCHSETRAWDSTFRVLSSLNWVIPKRVSSRLPSSFSTRPAGRPIAASWWPDPSDSPRGCRCGARHLAHRGPVGVRSNLGRNPSH